MQGWSINQHFVIMDSGLAAMRVEDARERANGGAPE
jgi:hypothetical protein